MYRLYSFAPSGNSYKVRLLMTQLGLPFELIECDVRQQGTCTPEYLAKNPNGKGAIGSRVNPTTSRSRMCEITNTRRMRLTDR
jgi:Glutathione S-transferase, N-terminal domain